MNQNSSLTWNLVAVTELETKYLSACSGQGIVQVAEKREQISTCLI